MPTSVFNSPAVMLGTSETTIFQLNGSTQLGNCAVRFTNIDTLPHNLTVYDYDPSGTDYPAEAAGPATTVLSSVTVPPRSFIELGPLVLAPNRKVSAFTDAVGVMNARPHGFKTT
jgi:hypothetical protein